MSGMQMSTQEAAEYYAFQKQKAVKEVLDRFNNNPPIPGFNAVDTDVELWAAGWKHGWKVNVQTYLMRVAILVQLNKQEVQQ
jgi:hypothetical protein